MRTSPGFTAFSAFCQETGRTTAQDDDEAITSKPQSSPTMMSNLQHMNKPQTDNHPSHSHPQ